MVRKLFPIRGELAYLTGEFDDFILCAAFVRVHTRGQMCVFVDFSVAQEIRRNLRVVNALNVDGLKAFKFLSFGS